MYQYEIVNEEVIKRTDENNNVCFIPVDEKNRDYKQYLKDSQNQE